MTLCCLIAFATGCASQHKTEKATPSPKVAAVPGTKPSFTGIGSGTQPPSRSRETIIAHPSQLPREISDTDEELVPPEEDEEYLEFGPQNQNILDEALDFCQLSQDYWQKGEIDNALQALDTAYSLILKVNTYNRPRLIQQKEDLRHLISKRIVEIYSSRYVARRPNHNSIPLVMNDHVKAEIHLMTAGVEKDFFINAYRRSGRYRHWIEQEFVKEGLPVELSWLPLIESGFKSNAYSSARALGIWQFIASTGYRFGLSRDNYIDERMDPYKSTKAAISYLKELHNLFGDWETVLAAYNCGEGRVMRTINTQAINYLDNFWDLYEKLPRETARYVPRFIATLHIVSNPAEYGLEDVQPEPPLEFENLDIQGNLHLKSIADATGIPHTDLKLLNPELRWEITPGDTYALKIPTGYTDILMAKLEDIPEVSQTPSEPVKEKQPAASPTYVVKKGDTLTGIAKKHRMSAQQLAKLNNIRTNTKVKVGATLVVAQSAPEQPAAKAAAPPARERSPKKEPQQPVTYEVNSGDNLFSIAKRYGTTVKIIQEFNRMSSINLVVGQVIQIPSDRKPSSSPLAGLKKYQVRKGDNAFSIASRHKMPVDRFLSINNLTSSSKLIPGQKLYVE